MAAAHALVSARTRTAVIFEKSGARIPRGAVMRSVSVLVRTFVARKCTKLMLFTDAHARAKMLEIIQGTLDALKVNTCTLFGPAAMAKTVS